MEEIEYADLEWAKECEVGERKTIIVDGRKFDIISINDLDDQILRDRCTTEDSTGMLDFDIKNYKIELLKKCVVKPDVSTQFIDALRKNKKSGTYAKLVNEVMVYSGTSLSSVDVEKEKNSESPTESSTSSK